MNDETDLPAEVLAAIKAGRKIEAIKLLREQRGIGLKEAKDIVDVYIAELSPIPGSRSGQSEFGVGRLIFAVLAAAAAYVVYRYLS